MKVKGANAERELVQMFSGVGWAAVRVAGSGISRFPCPDVLAGNGQRMLALECKSTKHKAIYFDPGQISRLLKFARNFGAEPWIAVKFSTIWKFFPPDRLLKTQNALKLTQDMDSLFFIDLINLSSDDSAVAAGSF